MQVRSKLVPLGEMSRLDDNTALKYFSDAAPYNKRVGDDPYTIPYKQIFCLIGGRESLAWTYGNVGPAKLFVEWASPEDVTEPNMWVIRHKQIIGHNYTLLAFGALLAHRDPYREKNPVFDLRKELSYDTSRDKLVSFMRKLLDKKK